eukprot:5388409-Prymnesium_polylepis.1
MGRRGGASCPPSRSWVRVARTAAAHLSGRPGSTARRLRCTGRPASAILRAVHNPARLLRCAASGGCSEPRGRRVARAPEIHGAGFAFWALAGRGCFKQWQPSPGPRNLVGTCASLLKANDSAV